MAKAMTFTTASADIDPSAVDFVVANITGMQAGDIGFIDKELMRINAVMPITGGTTGRLSVQRGYGGTAGGKKHLAGTRFWFGKPGDFSQVEPSGAGDPNAELALPRIVFTTGRIFDLVGNVWVLTQDLPRDAEPRGVFAYTAAGALTIADGVHKLSGGAHAMTLAAPTTDDEGKVLNIVAASAHAFTVTYTAGFNGAGAGADVATFGGAIGDNVVIVAINGVWQVRSLRNVTLG